MTYVHRLAAAYAAQDVTALFALAVEAGAIADSAEREKVAAETAAQQRRTRRAEQKRAERRRMSPFVAATNATTNDGPSVADLPPFPPLSSPTPLLNPSFPPEHLAQSNGAELDVPDIEPPEGVALKLALSAALGERVADVRRFLATRRKETWPAWMRQMLQLVGPGSQFTADDLADACNDALALDEPISGPHALRAFIAKKRQERMVPPGTQTRVGRAITTQDADERAAEQRRRNGLVSARRCRNDGDAWWERMQRESGAPSPWAYAYEHMDESAEGGPRAA